MAAAALCLLAGCDEDATYSTYRTIQPKEWDKGTAYNFSFHIDDTTVVYDLYVHLRNNNLYPYQNLWIFGEESGPENYIAEDTLNCILADDYGKWLGHGISLFESAHLLHGVYRFPHKGEYHFSFRQGMRDDSLRGIQEIGLEVRVSGQAHTRMPQWTKRKNIP